MDIIDISVAKRHANRLFSKLSEDIGDLSKLSTYGTNVVDILLKLISGGNITPEEKEVLETYNIFVPQNVSDEWNTGGTSSSGASRVLNMSTTEFLELFYDGFVTTPPDGMTVTKTSIGKDESGTYDMWEYDFKPTNYSRTILLSSGMHTYELSASFGLANFIGHLYTDTDNEAFEYIRKNVRVKVIPIVNPWGFNQNPKTYGNVNGVNPNRNFDLDGAWSTFPVYTPSQNEWNVKGAYPFSEAEARNLAKWANDNYNAEFWIDCHTGLGYNDKDLWVYYSSDSKILDRINGGISRIETWFKETYGKNCVTTRTIDNEGSIRLRWAEVVGGINGFTLEQAPHRTTFGTASNNDSGDISNYSTNISTFVQEFLLEKYRDKSVVKITSVSASDVTMGEDELSKTVEVAISPTDTTQNHFKWTSSNENVVEVYGGTNKAVLVNKGVGTATITLTNRYDSSVSANFEVTVMGLDYYSITNNLTNVTSNNNSTSIQAKSSYNATLNANNGYSINSVKITMGVNDITSSVYSNGVINIPSVTGNLVITVVATSNIVTITNNLTNVTTNNSITSMEKNNPYSANLTVVDGYTLQSVKVVMGGVDVTSSVYSNGVINIETVNGNIVITANAICIATSTNLGVESGSIDVDGTLLENNARFRTGFIEIEYEPVIERVTNYELTMNAIDFTDGTETESTTRCSTSYIPVIEYYDAINVETDVYHSYLVRYYKYENGEYKFLKSDGNIWIDKARDLKNMPKETTHLRLVFRGDNTGNSTITNIDISNTVITFIKSVAIDLDLGDNYGYYFRFYDHDFGCDESFKENSGANIAWSGTRLTMSQGNGLNGKGTLRFATVNTIKYIRLIGYDVINYGSEIDVSTLTGSITVNGVEYDLAT